MPHRLAKPDPKHVAGPSPMMATLRYSCGCVGREVLSIAVAFAADADEEMFVWTMRQAWRDMQTEIRQHTGDGPERRRAQFEETGVSRIVWPAR